MMPNRRTKRKQRNAQIRTSIDTVPNPVEVALPSSVKISIMKGEMQAGTRAYRMGKCGIFVSPPMPEYGWHLSISTTYRYPTWDEIAQARYKLLPEELTFAQILPPMAEYINHNDFVFHLSEVERAAHPTKGNLYSVRW